MKGENPHKTQAQTVINKPRKIIKLEQFSTYRQV